MSHDIGCWCGRERYEYASCPDEKCFKKKKCDVVFDFHSPHNNEYWYKCNTCGATDWFAYYHRDKVKRDEPLKDCKMRDTDWRPSVCPDCGVIRAAAEYPVCENKECRDFGRGGHDRKETRTMKTETKNMRPGQYLWVRPNSLTSSPLVLIDDPVELFRGNQFDESVDKLYQIGNEVKFKVSLEPVPNYRLGEDKMKTVRAISGSSDDLDDPDGVGNYRG